MEIKITAILIVKNEEKMLHACLKTLSWVDEIVVVDTGSTDQTIRIAQIHGAKIIKFNTGKTFSDWRNEGLRNAKGRWVLYIDADERVTPKLKKEISSICQSTIDANKKFSYAIPRRNIVLGKELKHGGFSPDYVKRLFYKSNLKKWSGELHEEPIFKGELKHLMNPLIHNKHESIEEMVEKTNNWSEIEGKLMYEANHPKMNIRRFISAMLREFWKRMIVEKAFLDGPIGIIFAMYQVFSRFVSYSKLWELQITKNK